MIDLNLNNIITRDELNSKLTKNRKEIMTLEEELEKCKDDNNYDKRIKDIKEFIIKYLKVEVKLNIYINLFIDKIEVVKGCTRHKMDLIVYFNDGNIKNIHFEN